MITRESLLESMKENEELEELVLNFGGVDKAVASINVIVPAFESFANGIKKFIDDFVDNDDLESEEADDWNGLGDLFDEEVSLFTKALNMCDVDVEWRYNYLDDLLCSLQDESMELYEELERAKIDEEIAEALINDYGFDARNDLINCNIKRVELQKELEEIEYRIEATNDLYDEVFYGILENYDDVVKINDKNEAVLNKLFFQED